MKVCIIIMVIILIFSIILYSKNRAKAGAISLLFCISMITTFLLTETRLNINKGISLKNIPHISVYNQNVKISAFLSNITPSMNSTIYATVKGPPDGKITVICHFKNSSQPFFGVIGKNGIGSVPINVGNVEPNFNVVVDVIVEHSKGTSKTTLFFIPK